MPRKARKHDNGKYFHVLVEGFGTERIFGKDEYKDMYLNCLSRARERYPTRILAYTVLDTHAHVLVAVNDVAELSNFFKRVNADYAMRYNRAENRSGYVFKDRYRSESIANDKELIHYANKIHMLCLKDGTCEHQDEYKFSSYRAFLTGEGVLSVKTACRLLGSARRVVECVDDPDDTDICLIDRDDREYEDKATVVSELFKKHKIVNNYGIRDAYTCRALALELRERTGASIRQMAELIGIGRETLRKWLKKEQVQLMRVTEPIIFK